MNVIREHFLQKLKAKKDTSDLVLVIADITAYLDDRMYLKEPEGRTLQTTGLLSKEFTDELDQQQHNNQHYQRNYYRDYYDWCIFCPQTKKTIHHIFVTYYHFCHTNLWKIQHKKRLFSLIELYKVSFRFSIEEMERVEDLFSWDWLLRFLFCSFFVI